ncbi:MAG: malto-oligosyltrehalose trehalohydrolase [Prolixibacteraceae bacterium]
MIYKNIYPVLSDGNFCEFVVWAPKAGEMHVVLEGSGRRIKMNQKDFGYWELTEKNIQPGTRYKYQINSEKSFPDPASLSQPDGVHKASEVINLNDFNWTDSGWNNIPLNEMIQYELHTGTFSETGDFDGIISKLDYLKDLGVNTLEILPVSQFSGQRNWGYDGVYPFAVQNSYGGPKKLMELINICHEKGMAVIMDVVYNHFGPEGNYTGNFGHYFTDTYSTPWGESINFDGQHSDAVRNYVVQNALMWCRHYHIDGLRLDAVHAIYDFSARHIMQELAEKVAELEAETGRKHYLIAESHLNDVRYISPTEKGGYGLDAQWSDDFHHAVHTLTTGEKKGYYMDFGKPEQLSKAIKNAFVFDGKYSEFRKKTYGNSTKYNPGEQFVIFNQNHDQVGNRLHGDRLISMTDFETAKVIAGATLTAPNIPMLFMGEEYGERNPFYYFVSHLDPNLNKLVREGRKNEFKDFYADAAESKNPDAPETFEASKLSWNIENDAEKKAMHAFYRKLIRLRTTHPVLKITDKKNLDIMENGKLFVMERRQDEHRVIVIMNFDEQQHPVTLNLKNTFSKILDSAEEKWNGPGSSTPEAINENDKFQIQKKSVLIYSTQ